MDKNFDVNYFDNNVIDPFHKFTSTLLNTSNNSISNPIYNIFT